MADKSRYENYVVRNSAVLKWTGEKYVEQMLDDKHGFPAGMKDLGFRIICSKNMIKDTDTFVEYGFVKEDCSKGTGKDFLAHKHPYPEIFLFMGTNTSDLSDLGAEVEFWMGEGKDLEKIILKKSGSIFVPPNVAHFPQFYRNVKRPLMTMVIMPKGSDMSYTEVKRPEL